MQQHSRQKPKTQQRAKPNLFIQTEFQSEDDAANTVVLRLPDTIQEFGQDYSASLDADPLRYIQKSMIDNLNIPERSDYQHRDMSPRISQQTIIGLKTLNIFQKLWKRRMYIQCFNCLRLARRSSLTRQRSQTDFRQKHSASVVQPVRHRWGLLNDRSVNRIGVGSEDASVERARILNQIVDKLSQKSGSRRLLVVEQPSLHPVLEINTSKENESQFIHQKHVQNKLDRLETMLRDIKKVHEASTLNSTVFCVKKPVEPRRARRKQRQQDQKNYSHNRYLIRQGLDRSLQKSQRDRLERDRIELQRYRLEREKEELLRLKQQTFRQQERARDNIGRVEREDSAKKMKQLARQVHSLRQEIRQMKAISESSYQHGQAQHASNYVTNGNAVQTLLENKGEMSPRVGQTPKEVHQFLGHHSSQTQLHHSNELRHNGHMASQYITQTRYVTPTGPFVRSPIYIQTRSISPMPQQHYRTRVLETQKSNQQIGISKGRGLAHHSRSPTNYHNCPLCGCGLCAGHPGIASSNVQPN